MIIKDDILNPYFIDVNYNGYHVCDSTDKNSGKHLQSFQDLNGALGDIAKRLIGANKKSMTLSEFRKNQEELFLSIQKAVEIDTSEYESKDSSVEVAEVVSEG